ncbi:PREDICTED: CBL-interacting serine/threonine-protein kinase 4-like [Nicotiana attenuata]|uniref:non-specific serine/threonine protein kinase n=1 Tax=Nicotiana attenuata TaxID=49451 RepID=A0A314LE66_NICAT|nr:PREDICTED: CBL-interacting serine/threonine-protein kinase 4-like [Nicotiana attenuata]OIT39866.1 cbl-interacting serinethreonine-protein kinase 4 [Nicotiana attenuata]
MLTATPPSSASKIRRTNSGDGDGGGSGSIILGKYQLNHLLGRGSFAKVYHARCLNDGTDVAIKVMNKNTTVDASLEQIIIREVSAMHRLNHHPNIIKLHEVMATKTKIYLVMELAPGGDLSSKLSRCGKFSYSTARFYFHQLVSALHFCHQNGVAHRDIKPQNILLDKEGQLKVSDFGLAALSEQFSNSLLQTACGTPAYAAPEVVYRKGYDGAKADAWSCGVILFSFLAGKLPFDDSSLTKLHLAKHRREFQFPDCVQKPARSIISRLLDPNPNTRLSIEELMELPWFKKSAKKGEESNQKQFSQGIFEIKDCKKEGRMNAFDIISMSAGLDLSGLFKARLNKKEMRFTTTAQVGSIEEKVMKKGKEEGYRVERTKGGGIGLVKGRVALLVEIWEVAVELWLVEIKVVNGGVEFDESHWEVLKVGLKDIVVSWYDDGS